jgi:hypothetical protein
MSHSNTSLVDTQLAQIQAPAAARSLYARLVGQGAIENDLRKDIPHCLATAFAVREGFTTFDAALGALPGSAQDAGRPRITAVEIHASGHRWEPAGHGGAILVEGGGDNGIFANFNGGFVANCPACAYAVMLGEEGGEALEEALTVWSDAPESGYMACPECSTWAPLPEWRSTRHDFAVGHYAMTLWGEHMLALTGRPGDGAVKEVRLLAGDARGDFAVVYCRI